MIWSRKRLIKWFGLGFMAFAIIAVTVSIIIVSQRDLPTEDLRIAREALSLAKEAEANIYAEKLYKESVQMYDSAMVNWARENTRFILFRDYTKVISFARLSKKKADSAKDESLLFANNLSKNVQEAFVSLAKKIELYNKLFKDLPLPKSVFDAHNKSKMFLSESKIAHENGKLKEAEVLFKKADIYINHANTGASKMLRGYFEDYSNWKRMANEAISASKGGNKVILVDKVAHILYVYQSGKAIRNFDAEFGPNWMAHKERNGDRATPEGHYRITSKKERGKTDSSLL